MVTLVGHAIWALVARLIRVLRGTPKPQRGEDWQRCCFCRQRTLSTEDRCQWCGRDLRGPLAVELSDLEALYRQLHRFRETGALKAEVVQNLLARVDRYRQRLLQPPAPDAQAAAVAPVAPTLRPATEPKDGFVVAEIVEEKPLAAARPITPTEPRVAARPQVALKPKVGEQPKAPTQPQAVSPVPRATATAPIPQPPPEPPAPRRSWAELMAGFMEERNIRWGELIGGLLIVGSSVALVVSLRETLKHIPYFQFLIFAAISSAVFGVGLYAHHRWKLESTSRGLLVIATLLVPLDFLAMAGPWRLSAFAMELIALGLFAWLIGLAAQVLVPEGRWLQVFGVLASSAGVLVVHRWIGADSAPALFVVVGCLTVACFAVAVGGYLYRLSPEKRLGAEQVAALFTLLGTAAFATAVALGLSFAKAGDAAVAIDRLSMPLALAGLPILAAGLTVVVGTRRDDRLGAFHVAGTTVALLGMVAMLAALAMAWPHPLWILLVGTLNAVALLLAAFRYRLYALHAGAIACGIIVYLTGFHMIYNDLPLQSGGRQMLRLLIDASSGTALGGLFVVLGLAAEWLARHGRRRDGLVYAVGCGVMAVVGLMLVTFHGLRSGGADALRATILYALYGTGSLMLVARWRRAELSYLGLGLLTAGSLWLLWWQSGHVGPAWATLLAAEALAMGAIAAVLGARCGHAPGAPWQADLRVLRSPSLIDRYRVPLRQVAEIVAPAALALGLATVWFDRAAIAESPSPWPALTAILLATLYLLLAWGYRSPERTWAGSMILLAGLGHTLALNYAELVDQPWLVALLAHSTLAVAAAIVLDLWPGSRTEAGSEASIQSAPPRHPLALLAPKADDMTGRVFVKPLSETALLSSVLVLPVLPFAKLQSTWSLALCLFWLAAIWLVIAWRHRHLLLFSAHQAMLAMAAVTATTAWLKGRDWVSGALEDLLHPYSLQAYGIVLGAFCLGWMAARIVLRNHRVARVLLEPHGPSVDRIVRHAVVCGLLLSVGWFLLPGIREELLPGSAATATLSLQHAAVGGGAWMVLAVMAAVMAATLWYRWRISMTSSLLLAATVPGLIAGGLGTHHQSVASALRWGSAFCFVGCATAIWGRKHLLALARRMGAHLDVGPEGPSTARATLLATTAAVVLAVTLAAAILQFGGIAPAGPAASSFFDRIGPSVSYLLPLALVLAGLVGFALRERSAAYAFSAGLVAEMIVTLGYALSVTTGARLFRIQESVTLIQLATITAAVWAGGWLAVRSWLDIWREDPETGLARVLMRVQLAMAAAGNVLLIVPALAGLTLLQPLGPPSQAWTAAAGRPIGWIALVLLAAAYVFRQLQLGRRLPPQVVGLTGMTVLGLLACTVQWLCVRWGWPLWGYRTLMLGWAAYAWFIVSATWWVASVRTLPDAQGPPQALIRAAAVWVRIAGILAVLLGLKAAWLHESYQELLWAAGAIATASAAGATMAVWRRREGWAFSAAFGVNLAASLVVWYFHRRTDSLADWWLRLVQANVIASAGVGLVWLAVRRRLYQLHEFTLGQSPLLAAQITLPQIGNIVLLVAPVVWLVHTPGSLPEAMARLAEAPGWLALLLAVAAAGWYLWRTLPGELLHVVVGLGLGAGVLAACRAGQLGGRAADVPWAEYHTLCIAWTLVGLVVLALGILGKRLRLPARDDGNIFLPTEAGGHLLPGPLVQGWVTAIGAAALALAVLHATGDPQKPWWSGGVILGVSLMAGAVAVWRRQPAYVFFSGLLLNTAGVIAWLAWQKPLTLAGFVHTNVLCLAAGSVVWSLLSLVRREAVPHVQVDGRPLPFAHLAAGVAAGTVAVVVALSVVCDLIEVPRVAIDRLDWIALAATAAAAAVCLWDRSSRFTLPGLYLLGLSAVGMGLCARELDPRHLCFAASVELAGFVLVTAVLEELLPRMKEAWRALRIPEESRRWPAHGFAAATAAVAAPAVVLSAWISLDDRFAAVFHQTLGWPVGQAAGPLAAVLLMAAAVLVAGRSRQPWRQDWQQAALGLGFVLLSEIGFAWLVPQRAPWLHRSVIVMVAAVAMTLVASFVLGRVLSATSEWAAAGRRMTPAFGALAATMLVLVLGQEVLRFDPAEGVPMHWSAIGVVAVGLAALAAGCIAFAVRPDWDPLQGGDRQRALYVYAAEVLAALIGLHIWLTMPWLFTRGLVRQFWMLIVMAVAFGGAGLSEWFQRRKMPVLSEPLRRTALLLPLAPAVAFWFMPDPSWPLALIGRTPVLWFLMGLFYGYIAVSRRSLGLGVLAIVAGNTGLWVAWHEMGIDFFRHPQLWLIPIALAVLVAEHLDRGRLSEAQRTGLRYLALAVIYVSSTTEFMRGIYEQSILLPLVLIGLSVAGVLAGVLLRVRAFLYLGVTFLSVVIVRMIVYAALEQGQIWIFWTCCILLGAAIIALFAVFEKRRNDVLLAVERFKQWER